MSPPSAKPARSPLTLAILLACLAASFIAYFWIAHLRDRNNGQSPPVGKGFGLDPIPTGPKRYSHDESIRLIDLRNQAIGNLENHEFAKASSVLTEILRRVPNDPFAPRNLAISRQLALEKIDRSQFPDAFANATELAVQSVERSKLAEPKSFVPWTIAARVAAKLDQSEKALADLREAMRLQPDAVGPAYDLFTRLQSMPGDKNDDESLNTMRRVFQQEPNNLFVIKDWLPLLARRKSPELIEALSQAKQTVEPFVETIKINTNSRNDLREIIDTAIASATEGNWPSAQRSVTALRNLLLSEAARDKRFVMLDSLEYVLPDFGEEFLANLDLPDPDLSASRPVHFLPPDDLTKWPQSTGCRDVAVTDFDLDGKWDFLVLQENQLAIWGRKTDDQPWTIQATVESEGSYSGFLAFDFDNDFDQNLANRLADRKASDVLKHESASNAQCHTADPDAILFGPSGLKLLENQRKAETDARSLISKSGGTAFDNVREVIAATVLDLDADGDLDLVISTNGGVRVFSNRGDLTFVEISDRSLLPPGDSHVTAMTIVDWDRDSDVDMLIAFADGCGVLENVRHGRLRYRRLDDFSVLRGSTTLNVGDFDGNASWDVMATGPQGANVVLTNRTPAGQVSVKKLISLASTPVRSAHTGDFDNDGGLDVLVLKDDGATIFRGRENLTFSPNPRVTDEWLRNVLLLTVSDLDRDGDLDLVVADAGGVHLLSSQCQETDNPHHGWLEIQLIGARVRPGEQNWDKRVNHINLGGMVELKAGDRHQAAIVTSVTTHFGLGTHRHADIARILWTNGIPTNVIDPAADTAVCIEQKRN